MYQTDPKVLQHSQSAEREKLTTVKMTCDVRAVGSSFTTLSLFASLKPSSFLRLESFRRNKHTWGNTTMLIPGHHIAAFRTVGHQAGTSGLQLGEIRITTRPGTESACVCRPGRTENFLHEQLCPCPRQHCFELREEDGNEQNRVRKPLQHTLADTEGLDGTVASFPDFRNQDIMS